MPGRDIIEGIGAEKNKEKQYHRLTVSFVALQIRGDGVGGGGGAACPENLHTFCVVRDKQRSL